MLEKEHEVGGLCRTIKRNGYTWDYSGHFFHFKDSELKKQFVETMPPEDIIVKEKNTKILFKDRLIDFPFQKNIHQLEQQDFIECLYDLYFKEEKEQYQNFEEMLYGKFGVSITEKFLKPYNEKLYACHLNTLEVNAMGRFFPYADIKDIISNMKQTNNTSYNGVFLYPKEGAASFIHQVYASLDPEKIWLNCELLRVDKEEHVAYTTRGEISYEYLINTIPLDCFCKVMGDSHNGALTANKVLVFNIGFDKKSVNPDLHWLYFPEKKYNFYRVGFYDNILDQDRMSIYVEIGFSNQQRIDIDAELKKTLQGLSEVGIVTDHQMVDYCSIVMNPAYVHVSEISERYKQGLFDQYAKYNVYSIGRYGKWTYCSIEDCVLDARALAQKMKENTDE